MSGPGPAAGSERCWRIADLEIGLPAALVTPAIARMCDKGWYEGEERRALQAHLAPGDRMLELGGGAGLLACLAARRLGPGAVTTVEANPALLPVIERNLARNGLEGVTLRHGAALAGAEGPVTLHVPAAFWAAGTTPRAGAESGARRAVSVPGLEAGALIAETAPSVLVVDVEGAEAGFFETPLPETLRLIVLELHPALYPRATIAALFDRLSRQGFAYAPKGSAGAVVCFHRV